MVVLRCLTTQLDLLNRRLAKEVLHTTRGLSAWLDSIRLHSMRRFVWIQPVSTASLPGRWGKVKGTGVVAGEELSRGGNDKRSQTGNWRSDDDEIAFDHCPACRCASIGNDLLKICGFHYRCYHGAVCVELWIRYFLWRSRIVGFPSAQIRFLLTGGPDLLKLPS